MNWHDWSWLFLMSETEKKKRYTYTFACCLLILNTWPCMTLKKGFTKCLLFVSSANGWKDQNIDSSFFGQRKPSMEKALFDWPIMLQYDVKAKYRLISRKFSGIKFFHPSIHFANQKAMHVCIRSINQSYCSISLLLFVVSVLFAHFHLKAI